MPNEHFRLPRISRIHEQHGREFDKPKLGSGFLRAVHMRVESERRTEEERLQKIFAFPDARDDRMRIRTSVTDDSLKDALDAYIGAEGDIKQVVNNFGDNGYMREADAASALRRNNGLRFELGKHLLEKIKQMEYLPPRINNDSEIKRPKVPGYGEVLNSREYAVLLAIAMLDGTYKDSPGDKIQIGRYGDVVHGQHRYAAQKLLGIDHIVKNRERI